MPCNSEQDRFNTPDRPIPHPRLHQAVTYTIMLSNEVDAYIRNDVETVASPSCSITTLNSMSTLRPSVESTPTRRASTGELLDERGSPEHDPSSHLAMDTPSPKNINHDEPGSSTEAMDTDEGDPESIHVPCPWYREEMVMLQPSNFSRLRKMKLRFHQFLAEQARLIDEDEPEKDEPVDESTNGDGDTKTAKPDHNPERESDEPATPKLHLRGGYAPTHGDECSGATTHYCPHTDKTYRIYWRSDTSKCQIVGELDGDKRSEIEEDAVEIDGETVEESGNGEPAFPTTSGEAQSMAERHYCPGADKTYQISWRDPNKLPRIIAMVDGVRSDSEEEGSSDGDSDDDEPCSEDESRSESLDDQSQHIYDSDFTSDDDDGANSEGDPEDEDPELPEDEPETLDDDKFGEGKVLIFGVSLNLEALISDDGGYDEESAKETESESDASEPREESSEGDTECDLFKQTLDRMQFLIHLLKLLQMAMDAYYSDSDSDSESEDGEEDGEEDDEEDDEEDEEEGEEEGEEEETGSGTGDEIVVTELSDGGSDSEALQPSEIIEPEEEHAPEVEKEISQPATPTLQLRGGMGQNRKKRRSSQDIGRSVAENRTPSNNYDDKPGMITEEEIEAVFCTPLALLVARAGQETSFGRVLAMA